MNIHELVKTIIANEIANLHFCLPAKIVEYDFKIRKASVKPSLNQKYNDGSVVDIPIIHNVPVVHPSSGGASITFPVAKGDSVWLIFSEKSLEEWLQDGDETAPDDPRQNDLTDAIAFIGANPFSVQTPASNGDDFFINYQAISFVLKKTGGITELNTTTFNINATDVNVSGKLTADDLESKTGMKSATALIGGKNFATHTHNGVTVGGGITGAVT